MKAKRIASMCCKTPCYMLRIAQVGSQQHSTSGTLEVARGLVVQQCVATLYLLLSSALAISFSGFKTVHVDGCTCICV
jgi:hypothetical protein